MGITIILLAAIFASLSNLFLRKSVDCGGTTKGFLVIQPSFGFLFAFFLGPIRMVDYAFNSSSALFGFSLGLIYGMMMFSIGKCLEKGPLGLTFSVVNGSTVMPGLIMFLFFGLALGYGYSLYHAVGSVLVLFGLFWASKESQKKQKKNGWMLFAILAFSMHILFLIGMQWRALMVNASSSASFFRVLSKEQAQNQWIMPMIYLGAALFQCVLFLKTEKRTLLRREISFGSFGGIANALCTFFLIKSTEIATSFENAMIFPVFSVAIILICNSWGQLLYQEKVNWKACHTCLLGLVIGTVDWNTLMNLNFF